MGNQNQSGAIYSPYYERCELKQAGARVTVIIRNHSFPPLLVSASLIPVSTQEAIDVSLMTKAGRNQLACVCREAGLEE
ncbi:unnamed protein product [Linum trigynum]|uniref:Uncharacterized protein n=1 Tax=Linum trigynum TaxID=586398 RepID=A0AAV2EUA3_9ROSI